MIAPAANLLIYAYTPKDRDHAASRAWLESVLSGTELVGIPILSIHAFMRVLTHPRAGISVREAEATVNSWLELPHVRVLYPGDRHLHLYWRLCANSQIQGTQLTDAAIAAIAQEYGAIIYSHDRDFARFPGLLWADPLASVRKHS